MNTSTIPTRVQGPSSGGGTSYVTFLLAGEIYGVPAAMVREVIMWAPVTRIPNAGASVKGVINLRGEIVPVLDTRTRLGLAPVEPTDRTCIVVGPAMPEPNALQAEPFHLATRLARIPPTLLKTPPA